MGERDWLDEVWDRAVAILYGVVGALLAAALLLMLPSGCSSSHVPPSGEMKVVLVPEPGCVLNEGVWRFPCHAAGYPWCQGYADYKPAWDECQIHYCAEWPEPQEAKLILHEKCHCLCQRAGEAYGNDDPCVANCDGRKK